MTRPGQAPKPSTGSPYVDAGHWVFTYEQQHGELDRVDLARLINCVRDMLHQHAELCVAVQRLQRQWPHLVEQLDIVGHYTVGQSPRQIRRRNGQRPR